MASAASSSDDWTGVLVPNEDAINAKTGLAMSTIWHEILLIDEFETGYSSHVEGVTYIGWVLLLLFVVLRIVWYIIITIRNFTFPPKQDKKMIEKYE